MRAATWLTTGDPFRRSLLFLGVIVTIALVGAIGAGARKDHRRTSSAGYLAPT